MTPEELSDLKAKYIKEGYESCLREVKARVGSIKEKKLSTGTIPSYVSGYNECRSEIKKLINEI